MKFSSWNVNGLRAALPRGLADYVAACGADHICLQEVKATPAQVDLGWAADLGYRAFWNPAEKKGYSGVLTLTRHEPLAHGTGMGLEQHDREGRVQWLEFEPFHLVNVYTPNSQRGLLRLDYRQQWDHAFLTWLQSLEQRKPVVFGGDLNVAHREIDLANPKQNRRNAGFTDEERAGFDQLVEAGFIDTFRRFEPGAGHYSWWTYRSNARERNIGWRIDYWLASAALDPYLAAARIRPEVTGSDHCPVELELELP